MIFLQTHVTITLHDRSINMPDKAVVLADLPLATTTWLQVCELTVSQRPRLSDHPWFVVGSTGVSDKPSSRAWHIGIDIPLSVTLGAWAEQVRPYVVDWSKLACMSHLSSDIPYERIRWAIASARAGLAWPLWQASDTDVYNSEAMGCFNSWRRRRGATQVADDHNNDIPNLVGIRSPCGTIVRCCNRLKFMQAVLACLTARNELGCDPFFHIPLPITPATMAALSAIRGGKRLLPILQPSTGEVSFPYDDAIRAYDTWLEAADGQVFEKEERARLQQQWKNDNMLQDAYQAIHQGRSVEVAVAKLRGSQQQETHEAKVREYARTIDDCDSTLVQVYAQAYRKLPQCHSSVWMRNVQHRLTRHPARYSVSQQTAVKHMAEAVRRVCDRQLWARCLLEDDDQCNVAQQAKAEQTRMIEDLLSRGDWEAIVSVDDIVVDDSKLPHGMRARAELYNLLAYSDKDDADAAKARRRDARAAAHALGTCTCVGRERCERLVAHTQ